MTEDKSPRPPTARPDWTITGAMYLMYAAVVIRTLTNPNIRARLPVYLGLEFLYLVLLTLTLWRPVRLALWQHLYFVFQSLLVLTLISLRPKFDFIVILYILLSTQAVLIFRDRLRWVWVGILSLQIVIPLMIGLGVLQGLALALMPMSIGLIFSAYVTVTKEIEAGYQRRQALLVKLQEANRQLKASADQAEELSTLQERNRLARELHDTVSQTIFSISLQTRAAQLLQEREPDQLRPRLKILQSLTQNALAEMRGLIANLRPAEDQSARRPTP